MTDHESDEAWVTHAKLLAAHETSQDLTLGGLSKVSTYKCDPCVFCNRTRHKMFWTEARGLTCNEHKRAGDATIKIKVRIPHG